MNIGTVLGLAVLLAGYIFLYQMVALWSGRHVGWADAMWRGCPA